MSVQAHDAPSVKHPHPLFSSFTSARRSDTATLVTISGQSARDPETNETPEGLAPQIDICLSRIDACLQAAGATKGDITRLMYYIVQRGLDEFDAKEGEGAALKLIAQKAGAWLEGNRPASCYLRVLGMSEDKLLCEFECMAVVTKK
jgi:enamine deaminase RidA (YjgF/YER057c/UK114 family)